MNDVAMRYISAALRDPVTGLVPTIAQAVARSGRLPNGLTLPATPAIADEAVDAWVARQHADESHIPVSGVLAVHALDTGDAALFASDATEELPFRLCPVGLTYLARRPDQHLGLAVTRHVLAIAVRVALRAWPRAIVEYGDYKLRAPAHRDILEQEPRAVWGDSLAMGTRILFVPTLDAWGYNLV